MTCKISYHCDHCGKEVSPHIGEQWSASFLTVGPDIENVHACSKEHLALATAKALGLLMSTAADGELPNIAELCQLVARAQLSKKWISDEIADMLRDRVVPVLAIKNARIAELEKRLADAEACRKAADEMVGRRQMRIAELETQAAKDVADWDRLNDVCTGKAEQIGVLNICVQDLKARIAELENHLAERDARTSVDGKTPGQVLREARAELASKGYDDEEAAEHEATAVLRPFGRQMTQETLKRVRNALLPVARFEPFHVDTRTIQIVIDAELAKVETAITIPTKPTKPAIPAVWLCHEHKAEIANCPACIAAEGL